MMKQISVSIVLSIGFLLVAVSPIHAQLVDAASWWLIVNPNADTRSQRDFDSIVSLLVDRGKVPSGHIHLVEGDKCTPGGIQASIGKLASKMKQGDRLIFYFRGLVTIPKRLITVYLLTHGITAENFADGIKAPQLNRWFRKSTINSVITILDAYTTDPNLNVYRANRELPGDTVLVSIQRAAASAENRFAQKLLAMLQNDATDLDDNRQISTHELYESILKNASHLQSILRLVAEAEATILKLSPMLKVATVPDSASVFLNGEAIGESPQRIVGNLKRGTYEVEVRKPGYVIPPSRSVQIEKAQGESVHLSWDLESIAVYGSVKAPNGVTLEEAKVWVDGPEYERSKPPVKENGQYRLHANVINIIRFGGRFDTEVLAPGKTYTLRAESGDVYHAEATFTLSPHESIQRDLILGKKTWFEVAQMRFNRKAYEGAVAAFQNGIEDTTEFPPMSPAFTKMLFDSFSASLDRVDVQNIAYVIATAKLADRLDLREEAKVYWAQVKSKAVKGTPEYKLATKRLRELNPVRRLINIGMFVVLLVVLISGGYTLQKHRKARKG